MIRAMKAIPQGGPGRGATRRAGEAEFQQRVAALHGDRRNVALFDIAATFAIMAGVIFVLVRYPGPFSYALAFVGIGLMQYRIVVACHEAVHKALLYPLWLNEAVGSVHCALVGINLFWYRFQHLYHHAAKDVGHDPDAYIYEPILRAKPGLNRLLVWIFGTASEAIEKLRQKGIAVSATREANGMARLYSFAIVLVQAVLLLACTVWLSWWYYFAFWLAPLLTIAIFMNRTRVFVEHGYVHTAETSDQELAEASVGAIDLSATFLERFFIAPYMINYHFSHHRVPSIPYHRVSDLSRLLAERGEAAPSCPTYSRALHHLLWN
jgi:fatty acid desaturase